MSKDNIIDKQTVYELKKEIKHQQQEIKKQKQIIQKLENNQSSSSNHVKEEKEKVNTVTEKSYKSQKTINKSIEDEIKDLKLKNEILMVDQVGLRQLEQYIFKNIKKIDEKEKELDKKEERTELDIRSLKDERRALKNQINENVTKLDYKIKCNICNFQTDYQFLSNDGRSNARCPKCGSLERHRGLIYYLKNTTDIVEHRNEVLLQSPPKAVFDKLNQRTNIVVYGVDPYETTYGADYVMELEELTFGDDKFDYIISIHVLEHVLDDQKALNEIYRVLKPGGTALIMLPINEYLEKTIDQPDIINTLDLQKKYYKDEKHLRYYGKDIEEKIIESGLIIKNKDYLKQLSNKVRKTHRILPDLLYECTKEE